MKQRVASGTSLTEGDMMKIEQLQISGFGRIQGRELALSDGVTVLYGQNEAGKSTTLQFIRAMLYGIPGRSYPTERYEPPHGGVHGGVLKARDREGGLWQIRRFAAGGEGQGRGEKLNVTVNRADGTTEELGQAELERYLLGGVSRSMFRQLFAVSLDELQELAALQSDEMSSYLFHAGMGGGGEIMRAERRLVQDAEKLYKPRGKVQEAAKILQSIEKLEQQMADSRSYLPRYNDNTFALAATEAELAKVEERRDSTSARLIMLRKALEIRNVWLQWSAARLEFAGIPQIQSFPEEGAVRLQELEAEIRSAAAAAERIERLQAELTAELEQNPPDPVMVAQGPALERLDRRRSIYEDRRLERQRLAGELDGLLAHIQRILRSIDPAWTTAELATFSGAAGDREAARRYAAAFASYDRRMESQGAARQALRSRLAAAAASLQAAERALAREQAAGAEVFAALRPASAQEVLQLWDELQQAAERWREAKLHGLQHGAGSDEAMRARMASLYRRLLLTGAALTALLPAALWLTGAPPVSAWIALGLLAAADLALWAGLRGAGRRKPSPPGYGGDGGDAAAEMLRLRGLLLSGAEPESNTSGRPLRRSSGGPASPDASGLEAGMRELRRLMDAWTAWRQKVDRASDEREVCRTEMESLAGQEQALAAEMRQEEAVFTETAGRYEAWLRSHKLPEGLSPEGLLEIFSAVEQGNELLQQQSKLRLRLAQLEAECVAFEDEVLALMEEAGSSVEEVAASASQPEMPGSESRAREELARMIPGWLEARKLAWDGLKAELLRLDGLTSRLRSAEGEYEEARLHLERLKQRRLSLLEQGGAEGSEEFLRRSAAVQRRGELEGNLRQWELAMFGGWSQEGTKGLLALLDTLDASALEQERSVAEEQAATSEEERSSLLQRRGKLLQEREYLKERCLEDTVLQQLEEQRSALRLIAGQYAVTAITAELIGRTRRIYEQEKQPQVLRLASVYFNKLTEGEYLRVVMTLGHKELKAEHRTAGLLDSGLLSRGTAEQLYLALRLALAETMARQACLPLLFDDLFVNFDEQRLHAALSLLGELSATRQIVMMTCHRHVAEAAGVLIPSAAVISV
ncbi:AAA family ATPase [Paenibacillus agri]|uniref:AAA family ATPase n=1 Tax=Paenibacillus agri TaxID=2744309 RepID=A0A850EWI8_9BACL|nr:AAA family ATPase [Paenibacillus agri]NUU64009.1 AAA family ATPase [Paenibacillus agri]